MASCRLLQPPFLWLQVVFLGEYHDDAIAHSLELELLQQAHARYSSQAAEEAPAADGPFDSHGQGTPQQTRRSVSLSLEMLERDVQSVVDEYLAGHVRERDLAHVSAYVSARIWRAVLLCTDLGTHFCLQRPTHLLQCCLAWAPPAHLSSMHLQVWSWSQAKFCAFPGRSAVAQLLA